MNPSGESGAPVMMELPPMPPRAQQESRQSDDTAEPHHQNTSMHESENHSEHITTSPIRYMFGGDPNVMPLRELQQMHAQRNNNNSELPPYHIMKKPNLNDPSKVMEIRRSSTETGQALAEEDFTPRDGNNDDSKPPTSFSPLPPIRYVFGGGHPYSSQDEYKQHQDDWYVPPPGYIFRNNTTEIVDIRRISTQIGQTLVEQQQPNTPPPPLRRCHSTPSSSLAYSSPSSNNSMTPLSTMNQLDTPSVLANVVIDSRCYPEYYEEYSDEEEDDIGPPSSPEYEPRFPTRESYLKFLDEFFAGSDLFSKSAVIVDKLETAEQEDRLVVVDDDDTSSSRVSEIMMEEFQKENMQAFLDQCCQGNKENSTSSDAFEEFVMRQRLIEDRTNTMALLQAVSTNSTPGPVSRNIGNNDSTENNSASSDFGGAEDSIQYDDPTIDPVELFDTCAELSLIGNVCSQRGSGVVTESTHDWSPSSDGSERLHSAPSVVNHQRYPVKAPSYVARSKPTQRAREKNPLAGERTLEEQLNSLTVAQRACVMALESNWEDTHESVHDNFPDDWYLRFARCSPERPFAYKSAMGVMKRFPRAYLDLSISDMAKQLLTKTLFPVPGLKTKEGLHVLYMHPSRFSPKKKGASKNLINNLVYTVQSMLDREEACTNGICLLINMTSFCRSKFSMSCYRKFMGLLDGRDMPVRMQSILMVNPPDWFGPTKLKFLASRELRNKMHVISFEEMEQSLMDSCVDFLPDELGGKRESGEIIREFIAERRVIEQNRAKRAEI